MRRKSKVLISAVACALPVVALAAGGARGDSSTPGTPSTPSTPIAQLSGFRQMVVDSAVSPGYIFMVGSGSIVVTDLSGSEVTTLDDGEGVQGIALSSDGATLYAALTQGSAADTIDAITVSSIATPPLARTNLTLPSGDVPFHLAVQSGKLWVSYNDGSAAANEIGDIDLTTGIFAPTTATSGSWASPPELVGDPSDSGVLVAVLSGVSQVPAATFNTTTVPATVMAAQATLGGNGTGTECTQERQLAVLPGGKQFIAACDSPRTENVYSTTNFSTPQGQYASGTSNPAAVAVDADGTVAVGTSGSPSAIYVYNSGGTLVNVFTLTSPDSLVDGNGLAWEDTQPGPPVLAGVDLPGASSTDSLLVFGQPTVTRSAMTLTTPATGVLGNPVTLTGSLTLSNGAQLPSTANTVTVSRDGPGGPVALKPVTAGADGSFTVTDTPAATGTYTYTASYGGDAQVTTPATAAASVTISLSTTKLSLGGPAADWVTRGVTLTGTLAFGTGTVPKKGTPITVTRTVAGLNTSKQVTVPTGAGGTFTFTDTPTVTGAYTYTAKFAGGTTTAPATASHAVSVIRIPSSLTVTTSGTTFNFEPAVRVTAHLGPTFQNRSVSIYGQWFGARARTLLRTGRVDSHGNLTVTYRAPHSTTFTAVFAGDARYTPATVSRQVQVRARVSETISGNFSSTVIGGLTYRLFHVTATLSATVAVTPGKRGQCVKFEVQEFFGGAWNPNDVTVCATLDASSQVFGSFSLSQADIGYPYRIRADYIRAASDISNQSADSGWLYFMVEN